MTLTTPTTRNPGPLWKNRDFQRYWVGSAASTLGSNVSVLAYPLLVLAMGGTAAQAGLLGSCALVTRTVCRLPAGYLVDRLNRRRLMLSTDIVRAVAVATIPVAALLGILSFAQLLAVAVIEGLASSLFGPASGVALRRLVPPEQLTEALSKSQARQAAVSLIGPVLGGWLYSVQRLAPFILDAVSYVVSAVLIYRIRTPLDAPSKTGPTDRRISAGIRWLAQRRVLCSALAYAGGLNMVAAATELAVIVTLRENGAGGVAIGLVLACGGGGAVVGAATATAIISRVRPGVLIVAVGSVWVAVLGVFALTASAWVIGSLLTVLFVLSPSAGIVVGSAVLTQAPEHLQGRVSTAGGMLMSGLPAIGPALAGVTLGAFGTERTWVVLAAATAAVTVIAAVPLLRRPDLQDIVGATEPSAASAEGERPYPPAERMELAEEIHGQLVADPYRWLEDATDPRTQAWTAAQAAFYERERERWPGRARLAERLAELAAVATVSPPRPRGKRLFFSYHAPGEEHAVLMVAEQGGAGRPILDPLVVDPNGGVTLEAWQPSLEGNLLAYQLAVGGTEESTLLVLNIDTGEVIDGPIDRVRRSPVVWLPGGNAFYYIRRLHPDLVPAGEDRYHRRVYLHRIGTDPEDDVVVFGLGRDKADYYSVNGSADGRWLTVSATTGTAPRNDLWLADLTRTSAEHPDLVAVQEGVDARTIAHLRSGTEPEDPLYLTTDHDARRGKVSFASYVATGGQRGVGVGQAEWRDLIPEDPEAVLADVAILDGVELERPLLLVARTKHAVSDIGVYDAVSGARVADVSLPGRGSVQRIIDRPDGGHEAWFSYTDFTTPPTVYRYDGRTGRTEPWACPIGAAQSGVDPTRMSSQTGVGPDLTGAPGIEVQQFTYASTGGARVRMFVISSAGQPDRPRPTILTGYGGFGTSMTPSYSPTALAWVEAGGVYAVACLRGGGEQGGDWHRAGMRGQKQNVFDDLHGAADWLVQHGWTTHSQLGIFGGSNGGLLVGAALTQRPTKYAAVVCAAPLLDMVRYERSGMGPSWRSEYGSATNPEELGWLLSYSPYHHVRSPAAYPAVLFTVFDGDTRVDPLHARKMCAALQHATSADGPIVFRAEQGVGHGARALSRQIDVIADVMAFFAAELGLPLPPL